MNSHARIATETVVPGETGVLFELQVPDCLAEAIRACEFMSFDANRMYAHAQRFSVQRFLEQMRSVLVGVLGA
jgi:hypothetical protein